MMRRLLSYVQDNCKLLAERKNRLTGPPEEVDPTTRRTVNERTNIELGLAPRTERWKKINVLFNDALNTFYFRLYGVGHNVKDHSNSKRGNPLPPLHGLLFPISNKGSFICTIL